MTIPSHASTWLKTLFPTGIKAMANINYPVFVDKFLHDLFIIKPPTPRLIAVHIP